MGVIKGILSETIVSTNQKLDIKNCVEISLENLGATSVTVGKYPLGAGKRVLYKSSAVVLDNDKELDIKFDSDDVTNNSLYVQKITAVQFCNCLEPAN